MVLNKKITGTVLALLLETATRIGFVVKDKVLKKVLWIDFSGFIDCCPIEALSTDGIDILKAPPSVLNTLCLSDVSVIVITLEDNISPLVKVEELFVLRQIEVPIIVRIPRDAFELAVEVSKKESATVLASDIIDGATWLKVIERVGRTRNEANTKFVFVDPMSRKLLALTERVAASNVTVLLAGPTGAGKEVVAKILHDASPRFKGPFVAINCAAMPETLIEDMLFGHDKGSFTGATKAQPGLFEQAQGGTIFLDEIGEMSFHLQAKLLRILQERTVIRLGGQDSIALDIRVIAASNKNLKAEIMNHTFREDLYFRLSAFKITVPSLRDRPADIIPLAVHFASEYLGPGKKAELSEGLRSRLLAYSWPGNVRELQNVMLRATVLTENTAIGVQHLVLDDNTPQDENGRVGMAPALSSDQRFERPQSTNSHSSEVSDYASFRQNQPLQHAMQANEYNVILAALEGSQSRNQAAQKLGISPRTLRHKLQRLREQGITVTRAYAR